MFQADYPHHIVDYNSLARASGPCHDHTERLRSVNGLTMYPLVLHIPLPAIRLKLQVVLIHGIDGVSLLGV